MCGIAGWINYRDDLTDKEHIVERMHQVMEPRGPDADGCYLSRHAALGHRRLIVVDPAGGAQPMIRQNKGETYVLVYNGELYNTEEIRAQLESIGYSFSGHSDTEVLLLSYIAWGAQCLQRLNGIFAFAVWEEKGQKLFMARDRLGVKPLFFTETDSSFIFASELKGLLQHPAVTPRLDAEGLAEILVMAPSRTPGHGVFKGVKELKPGHYLQLDKKGGCRQLKYWSLESMPHQDDLDTTVETVRYLVQDAVKRQLVADVPVATFLSGGLDSSALTAIAASHFAKKGIAPLHSYSVDYADNDKYFQSSTFQPNADAPWVELVSQKVGTTHHYNFLQIPQLAHSLHEALLARDLPGMADVDSSLLMFCREVKKDVTVVLSGECADEVFGGYPWFTRQEELFAPSFPWIRNVEERMKLFSAGLVAAVKPADYVRERYNDALREVPRLPGESKTEARMREMFYLNITRFMPTLLDRKDRMSMAVGLEARVPFCDHRLVEYVWNIPWSMKHYNNMEKGILRLALAGIVPDEVLNRKKSPYPKTHHPQYLELVSRGVKRILDDSTAPLHQLVNAEAVRTFINSEGAAANFPWFGQLMGGPQLLAYFIQLNYWLREYGVEIEV
ncbi:asparagine synthase (glutamine-hydrolyzing) [Dethiobacter alkaliphilus]|uniref:asparagine synthase (glutamine-hydrolyzing) n=1 Tax=Dethiobacter alkaliphilus AHT 1 TaxID=555088 RepID=C0GHN0_DETAL|nr:asparagine synthase (glutamine-hydrolyzing) [Dethiobacter alkaliphilus]EEG77236.1 asparagine synthase (glutamine-hydrolyzing) [Dethiobacter alkaliphilus AHT 1]